MALAEGDEKLKKWKIWSKYTKKKPNHKEHCLETANLKSGNHPLVAALERCGYHDIVFHHDATHIDQWGSFLPAYNSQLTISADPFHIRVPDESGFLLPADDENCMQNCDNYQAFAKLREIAKDGEKREKCTKIAYDNHLWKVVRKLERKASGGAVLVALTRRRDPIVTEGYYKAWDDQKGCNYWQKYDGATAIADDYKYDPKECHDVKEGEEYHVLTDTKLFTDLGLEAKTPFTTQAAWDEMCKNVLGWKVKVVSFVDGANVNVKVDQGDGVVVDAAIPIRSLRKEKPGDTALFLGEVGQFIFKAEVDLFENKGYVERGKNVQPLCSEWSNIIDTFSAEERHFGDWDWISDLADDEEAWNAKAGHLKQGIQDFIWGKINEEFEYDDLGLGMEN